MAINISKVLVEYLKGDFVQCCLRLRVFFNCVLGKDVGGKKTKKSRGSVCITYKDSLLNKFNMLTGFVEGQSLSGRF